MNSWGLRSLCYERWRAVRQCDLSAYPCLLVQARYAAAVAEARAWRDDQRRIAGRS